MVLKQLPCPPEMATPTKNDGRLCCQISTENEAVLRTAIETAGNESVTLKTNVGQNANSERFTYIDALRGLAAVWVMFHHFIFGHMNAVSAHGMAAEALRTVAAHGYLGVEIFFVLSGFVISYSVRNASITPRFVGLFALRRSVRLDPPYWFVIFLTYFLF
jgi:peptidoglycan/LPS O-acetylase OafA/YrhL